MIQENAKMKMTASAYIREMFKDTADGKLTLTHYPEDGGEEYTQTYNVDWDAQTAKQLAKRFDALISNLDRIALLHDSLMNGERNVSLLTPGQQEIWETFLAPFEDGGFDEEEIFDLQMKEAYESLTEEEEALLNEYYDWYEQQCLQMLPYNRCSSASFVNRARRYEKLVSLDAPQVIRDNEARCLAEEMVLYYCMKESDNE